MANPDKKPPPYAERGKRLKERRIALDRDGKLVGGTAALADAIGATQSAYLAYERGEYWPKGERHRKLAARMGWSAIELDHGPQDSDTSPQIRQLITNFGWLTTTERDALLVDLAAKAETNKAISKELGPRWEYKPDSETSKHIKPAPTHAKKSTPPHKKKSP